MTPDTTMATEKAKVSFCVKWSTFVGIYLVRVFSGIPWVWGNMSIYVGSFFHFQEGLSTDLVTDPWLLVSNNLGFTIFLFIGSFIGRQIGSLTTIFFALVVHNAGLFLSYLSVQHSYAALCLTFGLIPGVCTGIMEANQFPVVVRWTEQYQGIATSSIPSFNILGAMIMILMGTLYINPENKQADIVSTNNVKTFSQIEILDRVPSVFILYGGVSLTLNCIGFLLLRNEPGDDCVAMKIVLKLKNVFSSGNHQETKSAIMTTTFEMDAEQSPELGNRVEDLTTEEERDITPWQVLKTKEFYALWLMMPLLIYMFLVVNNFYKTYGLVHISDDHFLAGVGTLNCLFMAPCTVFGGFVMDRIGVKNAMLGMTCLLCVVANLFYVTPLIDKWFFLVCTVAYSCLIFAVFCLISSCCLKLFGETYFNTIFGMVLSLSCVISVVTPYLVKVILSYGWSVFLNSLAGLALINVILVLVGLPKTTRYKNF